MYISSVLNSSRLLVHIRHSLWNREWNDSYKWWLFWTSPRGDICLFFFLSFLLRFFFVFHFFFFFFKFELFVTLIFVSTLFITNAIFQRALVFSSFLFASFWFVYCWLHIHSLGAKPARVSGTISTIRDREERNYVHWEKVSRRKE